MRRTAALLTALALLAAAPRASAQCRRSCALGEARDPYGCCIARRRPRARRTSSQQQRPETLVGDSAAVLAPDVATELYHWSRAWLSRARSIDATSHARAVEHFRLAASASLVFLGAAPSDPRAGRMRAVLVQALDGAGLVEDAEREASALGGSRPEESATLRAMREEILLNLAWAHQAVAGRLDASAYAAPNERARTRYRRAADYYRLYVASFPDAPARVGAESELANALNGAGDHEEAARVLDALAEAFPSRRAAAMRRAIDAYQHALADDVQSGRVVLRTDPPEPSQRPPFAPVIAFPEPLARLFDARERYLRATQTAPEPRHFRTQQLENALWLYRYGQWEDAERRLNDLLTERCDDGVARNAWTILASMDTPRAPSQLADVCSVRRRAVCSGSPDAPECVALRARAPR